MHRLLHCLPWPYFSSQSSELATNFSLYNAASNLNQQPSVQVCVYICQALTLKPMEIEEPKTIQGTIFP
jgi:hypothetical protein